MTSTKQLAANRSNAQKSTGPRTRHGKTRSSQNAKKHGLSAQQVVMLGEDPAAFEALREDLYAHYQPVGPVAAHLVEQVAVSIWRFRRVPEIEAGIFEHFYYRRRELCTIVEEEFGPTEFEEEKQKPRPLLGHVFSDAERSLRSLTRIAGAIEGSMHRAIRQLEHMKAVRDADSENDGVIDAGVDDIEASQPFLIQS